MAIVYISIGSNLGDREKYCQRAIEKVGQLPTTKLLKISSLIETDPVGKTDQPQFINIARDVKTLVENIQSRNLIQNVHLRVKRSQLSSSEAENAISPYRNNVEII